MFIPRYFVLSTLLITSLLRTRSGKSLPILLSCRLWPLTITVYKLDEFSSGRRFRFQTQIHIQGPSPKKSVKIPTKSNYLQCYS